MVSGGGGVSRLIPLFFFHHQPSCSVLFLCLNSSILSRASSTCLCTSSGLGRKDVRVAMVDYREVEKDEEVEEFRRRQAEVSKQVLARALSVVLSSSLRWHAREEGERESRAARSKAEKTRQARGKREKRVVRRNFDDRLVDVFFFFLLPDSHTKIERSRCRLSTTTGPTLAQEAGRLRSLPLLHSLLKPLRRSRSLKREEQQQRKEEEDESTMWSSSQGPWSSQQQQQQLLLLLPRPPRGPSLRKVT